MARAGFPSVAARHRWSAVSRTLAVTLGAYGLTALATAALSLLLVRIGMDRVEAVTAATLASFAIYAVIAIAASHAASAIRAWAWLLAFALPLVLALFVMLPGLRP